MYSCARVCVLTYSNIYMWEYIWVSNSIYMRLCMYIYQPCAWAGCDIRSILRWSLIQSYHSPRLGDIPRLNSQVWPTCFTHSWRVKVGYISFPRVLALYAPWVCHTFSVCVCVCVTLHIYVRVLLFIYVRVCVIYIYMHTHTYTHTHTHIYIYIYIILCQFPCPIYVCVNSYIYIYIYNICADGMTRWWWWWYIYIYTHKRHRYAYIYIYIYIYILF